MDLLPEADWQALMEGLVRRKYHVLLGAGFSLDVKDRLDRDLPSGDGLRDELVKEFGLPVGPKDKIDLSRAYDVARGMTSVNGDSLPDWLRFRFTKTTPPGWYESIRVLPVQAIWTLNIDDALEQLDEKRFKPVTFSDKHVSWPPEQVPVVHLHGYAAHPEKGLIFSITDYRRYVDNPRAYALQFQEVLSDGPVVVIGAALHHETDLAQALRDRARNLDSRWPSIVVKPDPTEFERVEFKSWGLAVVDASAESFLAAVRAKMPDAQRRLAPLLASEAANSPATVRFNQQWSRLSSSHGATTRYRDFLGGAEPLPIDIREKRTIHRDAEAAIKSKIVAGAQPILLHGGPFCGKSTLALQIATSLDNTGWQVYRFSGEELIDTGAVTNQVRLEPHTLLLIDDAALIANDVRHLLEQALDEGLALHLLCIDRTGPASRLLRWGLFSEEELPRSLSARELNEFIALIRKQDRLNKTWRGRKNADLRTHLSRKGENFASIICEAVIGEQFEERVRRDYRALTSDLARGAYLLGSVLARVTKGVPIGLVAQAFGTTGRRVEETVSDLATMESVCTLDRGRIRPRHRIHAELLLGHVVSPEEAFDPLLGLAMALAPNLDLNAIRYGTMAYRISAEVLDQEALGVLIGRRDLELFYSKIEDAYAWNSRYWEQRALAASKNHDHEPAVHFSDMALSAHRDAFSLNTASSIRLKRLLDNQNDARQAEQIYWTIVPMMRDARSLSRPDSEYSFVTFFAGTLRLARLIRREGGQVGRLMIREWADWEHEADQSLAFRDPLGRKKFSAYKGDWLTVVAATSSS